LIHYVKHRSRWIVQPLHKNLFNAVNMQRNIGAKNRLSSCVKCCTCSVTGLAILRLYLQWRLHVPNYEHQGQRSIQNHEERIRKIRILRIIIHISTSFIT
jgi:hypothetical protein